MNLDAIRKTAILQWSDEDEGYVIRSPLCRGVVACGDTKEEAQELFEDMLTEYYEDYKAGRLSPLIVGRPPKNKESFNTRLDPEIKAALSSAAKGMGISSGELIEYLFLKNQASS